MPDLSTLAKPLKRMQSVSNDIPAHSGPCNIMLKEPGNAMTIEVKSDAVKLFSEIGFLGLSRGQAKSAEEIFAMLTLMRPGEEIGAIGSALSALASGQSDAALAHLRAAEQTPAVIAFMAVAQGQLGAKSTVAELVEDLEAMDADPALLEVARGALS